MHTKDHLLSNLIIQEINNPKLFSIFRHYIKHSLFLFIIFNSSLYLGCGEEIAVYRFDNQSITDNNDDWDSNNEPSDGDNSNNIIDHCTPNSIKYFCSNNNQTEYICKKNSANSPADWVSISTESCKNGCNSDGTCNTVEAKDYNYIIYKGKEYPIQSLSITETEYACQDCSNFRYYYEKHFIFKSNTYTFRINLLTIGSYYEIRLFEYDFDEHDYSNGTTTV